MKKLALFLLCALLLSSKELSAQFVKGNNLYTWCNSGSEFGSAICAGYILAAVDTNEAYNLLFKTCIWFDPGPNVTGLQLRDVINKGLRDNPKDRDITAAILIQDYLSDAFPCPKK